MPRKPREIVAGGIYHVFARGNRRQPLFFADEDRRRYLALWGAVARDLRWSCLAYCLMDNHVHHVVELSEPNLSDGVQLAHANYARYLNDASGKDGHVFQGRFGSKRCDDQVGVWSVVAYVVLNPVRAGLCARPEDHAWSSHAATIGTARCPPWLDLQRVRSLYAVDGMDPVERYAQMVETLRLLGPAGPAPPAVRG
jgi:REP element-mobilizing transposase RayT